MIGVASLWRRSGCSALPWPQTRRGGVVLYCAALGLVATVYVCFSSRLSLSLTLDEAYTIHFARRIDTVVDDTWPPLYYGLVWLLRRLGCVSESALRLLSLLTVMVAGVVIAGFGRRIVGSACSLLAAVMVVLAPIMLRYAYWGRGYGLLVLVSAWVIVATSALAERRVTRGRLVAWAVGCWCAAATHHFGALLALSSYLFLTCGYLRGRDAARFRHACICLWFALSPLVLTNVRQLLLGVRAITAGRYLQIEQILKHFAPGAASPWVALQMTIGLTLLALAVFGAMRDRIDASAGVYPQTAAGALPKLCRRDFLLGSLLAVTQVLVLTAVVLRGQGSWSKAAMISVVVVAGGYVALVAAPHLARRLPSWLGSRVAALHPLAQLAITTLVVASIASSLAPISTPRNMLILLPAYYLLASRGFARLAWRGRWIAAVILVGGLMVSYLTFNRVYGRQEDWRGAVQAAQRLRQPGDWLAIRPLWGEPVLAYYGVTEPSLMLNRGDDLCTGPSQPYSVVVLSSQWHHVYSTAQWKRLFDAASSQCAEVVAGMDVAGVRVQRLVVPGRDRSCAWSP